MDKSSMEQEHRVQTLAVQFRPPNYEEPSRGRRPSSTPNENPTEQERSVQHITDAIILVGAVVLMMFFGIREALK